MNEFEIFIRQQAQNFPGMSLQTTLNLWNEKQGLPIDYDNDDVAWAMSVKDVVPLIRERRLVLAVQTLRAANPALDLMMAKNLMERVRAKL